jgi:hypothetical protein
LVLATQPARPRAAPLTDAEQLEPGTLVVVVVGALVVVVGLVVVVVGAVVVVVGAVVVVVGLVVVVVVALVVVVVEPVVVVVLEAAAVTSAADAGEMAGAREPAPTASIVASAVPAPNCQPRRPSCWWVISSPVSQVAGYSWTHSLPTFALVEHSVMVL